MGSIGTFQEISSDRLLIDTLSKSSHDFLQPSQKLHEAALVHAKSYIDPIATATSHIQQERQRLSRKKRKRGEIDQDDAGNVLRLQQLHLDGFSIEQIWKQASRVLDASRLEIERSLENYESMTEHRQSLASTSGIPQEEAKSRGGKSVRFRDDDDIQKEVDSSEDEDEDAEVLEFEDDDDDNLEEDLEIGDEDELVQDAADQDESEEGIEDLSGEEIDDDDLDGQVDGLDSSDEEQLKVFVPDKHGLNDGFFSIDDFNNQAEFLEQRDAQGQDDGAASDEQDVDWDADPLAHGAASKFDTKSNGRGDEESEDDEEGPTFGNADDMSDDDNLSGSAMEMEVEDPGSLGNTNSIRYADFFEPPPRQANRKRKKNQSSTKTKPPPKTAEKVEEDMQRTIAAVRRDIFEDDLTPDEDGEPSDPEERRSSHQKRQAALAAEIRRLEAAAVQKRDWTLSGEARAADRPLNSLLEEDLEFERVGKPVPVITQEVSEDIEALIKRRILARDFDEVIRRRPGNLATGAAKNGQRRGLFELSDAKPEQSLAEIYETEHLERADPAGHPTKAEQKLEAEQKKIQAMWKDVSAKLDALCSWHYRPKPPSAEVTVVADVPAISMEDARPAGVGGDVGTESMLAPQEIYKAGESRNKAQEVVTSGGLPVGRAEMTKEEKLRRRRREKERIRKRGEDTTGKTNPAGSKKAEQQKGIVTDLKKGGVRVIGRKGEIRDVNGNAVKTQQIGNSAGALKL